MEKLFEKLVLQFESQTATGKASNSMSVHLRIIGGKIAPAGKFPFTASVEISTDPENGFLCGGSVISDNYVVTAAHCMVDGETSRPFPAGKHQTFVHPDFDLATSANDIALIKVPKLSNAKAVPIYGGPIADSTPLTVLGWGRTDPVDEDSISIMLKEAVIKVGKAKDCAAYLKQVSDAEYTISWTPLADSCQGDSGQGVIIYVKGVPCLAENPTCGLLNGYGVYTHVHHYVDFISKITGIKFTNTGI
ncbi:trypsin-like serine protease [Linderina pennispora]|uniref:Trypsin-like serine protease n=1 Tax=Linderina pennispora TaxID=61395 RepID=A0A1Y1WDU3_9FUNG|nr:trypsin-like serine protease [Linderina pennispora]ORX71555.1 trypsin-like serine protease [Linderina pennispora]